MAVNWIAEAPQIAQLISSVILATWTLCSALSLVLGFVGSFWPPALVAAAWFSKVGSELHQFGAWLGSFFGGSKAAARGYTGLRTMALLAFCSLLAVAAISGCAWFKSNAPTIKTDVGIALTDTQTACVLAESAVSATPLAPDLLYLEGACGIAEGSEQLVQKVLNLFFARAKLASERNARAADHAHAPAVLP